MSFAANDLEHSNCIVLPTYQHIGWNLFLLPYLFYLTLSCSHRFNLNFKKKEKEKTKNAVTVDAVMLIHVVFWQMRRMIALFVSHIVSAIANSALFSHEPQISSNDFY